MNQGTMKITMAPGVPPAAWQGPLGKTNRFTQPPHTQKSGQPRERLSIQFEKDRTGRTPKWIAIDNNADGYDVLSVVDATDHKQLTIEVKTSTQGHFGFAMLTRNEWEMAMESDAHVFHLWNLKNPTTPKLAIVSNQALLDNLPLDRGMGLWDCTKIPFAAFKNHFA